MTTGASARGDFVRALPHSTSAGAVGAGIAACTVDGDAARPISSIGSLASEGPGVLGFCDASDAGERVAATRASTIIVARAASVRPRSDQTLLRVDDVRAAFIDVVRALLPGSERPNDPPAGVAPSARIDGGTQIAGSACIGANVVVGARTRIAAGAIVYDDCEIGDDCVIGPNAVVGWVGLAYHDRSDGRRLFFPHLAGVRIGHRVDVGAQACVCRGMLSHTYIGDDVKIGSLVYVSHGVIVDARAWLSAGTAIAAGTAGLPGGPSDPRSRPRDCSSPPTHRCA